MMVLTFWSLFAPVLLTFTSVKYDIKIVVKLKAKLCLLVPEASPGICVTLCDICFTMNRLSTSRSDVSGLKCEWSTNILSCVWNSLWFECVNVSRTDHEQREKGTNSVTRPRLCKYMHSSVYTLTSYMLAHDIPWQTLMYTDAHICRWLAI